QDALAPRGDGAEVEGELLEGAGHGPRQAVGGDGAGGDAVDPAGAEQGGGVDRGDEQRVEVGDGDGVRAVGVADLPLAALDHRVEGAQVVEGLLERRLDGGDVQHAPGPGRAGAGRLDLEGGDVVLVGAAPAEPALEVAGG